MAINAGARNEQDSPAPVRAGKLFGVRIVAYTLLFNPRRRASYRSSNRSNGRVLSVVLSVVLSALLAAVANINDIKNALFSCKFPGWWRPVRFPCSCDILIFSDPLPLPPHGLTFGEFRDVARFTW